MKVNDKELNNQKEFMREAIRLSVENVKSGNGGPFAAIIVKNGKIIASGVNSVTKNNDPTAHAEILAIRNACEKLNSFQLTDCHIYTSCEPCPMCLGAIYWSRPSKLFYANSKTDAASFNFDDAFIYQELELSPPKRELKTTQILRDEALKAFEEWKKNEVKKEY